MDFLVSWSGGGRSSPSRLVVTGSVDLCSRATLVEAGLMALPRGSGVALDLSGVDFMDASGISALVELASAARAEGRSFEVLAVSDPVERVLELTGLADRWGQAGTPARVSSP